MSEEVTPVELRSSQDEIGEDARDTPLLSAGTRVAHRFVLGFAATTQILNPLDWNLNDHVLMSQNMTAASEEEFLREAEVDAFAEEYPEIVQSPAPDGADERANRDRLELLARAYVAGNLSPEEDARLAIVTERVRRLIPRVTVEDFERLERMAEEAKRIDAEDNERRARLGLL